jgi:uncharacterized membrane protein
MTTNPAMRASDQDREHVVEILRTHYSEGRLTLEEFDERMNRAYQAKTYGELSQLTRDLPVQPRPDTSPVPYRRPGWPMLLLPLAGALLLGGLIASFAWGGMAYGHHHYYGPPPFVPIFPLIFIVFLLLRMGGRWGRGWRR